MGENGNGHDNSPEGRAALAQEAREAIAQALVPDASRSVFAMKGLMTSISLDGDVALMRFEDNQGQPFDFMFPLPARRMVVAMLVDIENEAKRRQAAVAAIPPRFPATFQIGSHDQLRGMTLFMFDDGTPNEIMYAMPDEAAWKLANNVRENILERKTPAERQKLLAADKPQRRIILPGR